MRPLMFLLACAGLTACDPQAGTRTERDRVPAAPTAPSVAPLVAAGPAASIQPDAGAALQQAASVVRVDPLTRQPGATVKLFGTAGGDPAMNGLQTHVAFFLSPADGWRVFRIGDVLDYRVLSEAPGRVDLSLNESVMDPATQTIGSRTRRIILGWPAPADGAAPTMVTVTPAQ